MTCRIPESCNASIIIAFLFIFFAPASSMGVDLKDVSWQKTFELYSEVQCLTDEELEYGAEVIAGLGYNSSRVFRKMCKMQGMDFAKSEQAWSNLISLRLSYEQVLVFEKWSDLEQVHVDLALDALAEIGSLDYEAGKSFRRYCSLPKVTPDHALKTIPLLNRLNDAHNRAFQLFLDFEGVNAEMALDGLGEIARLSYYQALAIEALEKISGMKVGMVIDALPLVRMLNMENAWNMKTLLSASSMTPDKAWYWLVAFFANPLETQEKQFFTLKGQDRQSLLQSFYEGGEELIWKINNLHGVTDRFGYEVSNQTLLRQNDQMIRERFEKLSPQVKSKYSHRFYQTGRKKNMVALLKKAIAAERVATARRLTSVNIYALLAQGSELYDSSFRNILVPELKKNINAANGGNLLAFLKTVDTGNLLVSNFIVSLAQKGKLTTFFPSNSREQEQILELVAESAFKDENAIILFSATFMHLLEVLEPEARSFLIARMSRLAVEGTAAYSRLIRVILQYYLEEFPHLLSHADQTVIVRLIVRHDTVNLHDYLATPFEEWKEDGMLASLSVFHPDDDGVNSFQSNARILLKSGYVLSLSDQFTVGFLGEKEKQHALEMIRFAKTSPGKGLSGLFWGMQRQQFAVSFVRRINGLTLKHVAYVYSDEKKQEQLLERFVSAGTEMLAQRGHSYWRSEQITEPMEKLRQQGRVSEENLRAKQRFLSLGSCGGVKAYTRLNRMFLGHVDILATIGSGLAAINDPYNKNFFEIIAKKPSSITWKDMSSELAFIFKGGHGRDYLQPGSLPAILHKILDEEKIRAKQGSSRHTVLSRGDDSNG